MLRYELPVTFNGVLLNDFITPSFSTDTSMLPEVSDSALSFTEGIGERFTRRKYTTRTIKIPYIMRNPTEAKRQALTAALAVTEPQKLTLGRTPDRYYLVIPKNGEFTIEGFRTSGTLEFTCYDGLAHSLTTATVSGQSGTDITVTNAGTAPTAPVLTATMTADNGLVAWTNDQGGVLQFGDPGEVDGVTTKAPEQALVEGFDSDPGGTNNDAPTNYPNYGNVEGQPNVQSGTMNYGAGLYGSTAMMPSFGAKSDYWNGPSKKLPIPKNSDDDNAGNIVTYTRLYFDTKVRQMGRMEIALNNGDKTVFESVLRDSADSQDQIVWECFYNGQWLVSTTLDRRKFKNGQMYELRMWRFGSKINFQLAPVAKVVDNKAEVAAPILKSFDLAEAEPIDSVSFWFCRWQDNEASSMSVTDFQAKWTDVDQWNDLANCFSAGDEVVADIATKTIYVNGVQDNTLHAIGNMWDSFWIQPGRNTIMPVASSWATPFDATIEYREAWL
ncbi:distal tail protein Dit [Lacticaseibacillus suilingensis]|uniref:Distal tail protein Dit n=2 Tax=Lacticaseibacillus suilingensis TaxID=2799577 RepID=A0ABW4BDW6_9LACO|nr:distal tail protein Dit [Lacticaseibacillus suilingensis]